ncbi:MAG: glycosyltransferase family 87 protein, partial [Anaerolineae bacterium]
MQSKFRVAALVVLVLVGIALLTVQLSQIAPSDLAALCGHDFTQYYSAARLLVQRADPYDPAAMLAMERSIGWAEADPLMMWNPPWTLALVLPLLALPFGLAAGLWLALNCVLVLLCAAVLWRLMAPQGDRRYWLAMLLVIAYIPTLQTLKIGQISLWLLVGITGFLVSIRTQRDYLAGALLVLLIIKPHIGFLFLLAIAWWVMRERRWRVLLGGAAALVAVCAVVVLISPAVLEQYLRAAAGPPLYWRSTTLGTWLRVVFGSEQHWLQFLPSVVGILLFAAWALRHKGEWNWPQLAPG